jgi:hypothetical protein
VFILEHVEEKLAGIAFAFFQTASITLIANSSSETHRGRSLSYFYLAINLSLARRIPVRDHGALQFRWETFNITNIVGMLANKYKLKLHETPIGFKYIAVDLEGYVPGSLNRVLEKSPTTS